MRYTTTTATTSGPQGDDREQGTISGVSQGDGE